VFSRFGDTNLDGIRNYVATQFFPTNIIPHLQNLSSENFEKRAACLKVPTIGGGGYFRAILDWMRRRMGQRICVLVVTRYGRTVVTPSHQFQYVPGQGEV
jgi:hypothetical protein